MSERVSPEKEKTDESRIFDRGAGARPPIARHQAGRGDDAAPAQGWQSVTKSLTIHGILANRSKSMSDQRRALLLPQELMQFPDGELLLLRGGVPPIHGDKIRFYADGLFRSRVMAAPVVPPIPKTVRDDEDLPECAMPTFDQLTDPDPLSFAMDCVVTEDHPDMLIDVSAEQRGNEVVGVIEQER